MAKMYPGDILLKMPKIKVYIKRLKGLEPISQIIHKISSLSICDFCIFSLSVLATQVLRAFLRSLDHSFKRAWVYTSWSHGI